MHLNPSLLNSTKYRITLLLIGLSITVVLLTGMTLPASVSARQLAAQILNREFAQQQRLTSSSGAPGDYFGLVMAIDGNVALISATDGSSDQTSEKDGVYVFRRFNGVWIEQQRLTPSHSNQRQYFGSSIALKGNTALIGASGAEDKGAVYVFEEQNGSWTQQQKLIATDGQISDFFGYAVDLDGDTALIGAPGTSFISGEQAGAAYIFKRQNGTWSEQQRLVISDSHLFGWSLALDGTRALIGAFLTKTETNEADGAVYAFERVNDLWTLSQKITANDPPNTPIPVEGFGYDVALDGNTAAISSIAVFDDDITLLPQPVHIMNYVNGTWVRQQLLTPSDGNPSEDHAFGYDMALHNGVLVSLQSSAAYVFILQNAIWTEQQKIVSDGIIPHEYFPLTVALHADTLMISASISSPEDEDPSGAVYVFNDPSLSPTITPTVTPVTATPVTTTSIPLTPTVVPDTPTTTATQPPGESTELLVNGGFELDTNADKIPDGWKVKQHAKDKRHCNVPEKTIAFEGMCVFQFKGSTDERSKLQQQIDLVADPVAVSDTVTLGGVVWAKGNVESKVTLKVKYAILPTDKLVINVSNVIHKQWIPFNVLQSSLVLNIADNPSEIQLKIRNNRTSGKVRYDALSVMWQSNGDDQILRLPSTQ
jgi:hypothetical protein